MPACWPGCLLLRPACAPLTLQDPIYVGTKHRRVRGDAYFELVDEFLTAVRRRYGTAGERACWTATPVRRPGERPAALPVRLPPSLPVSGPKPSVSTSIQASQTAACRRRDQLKRRTELPAPYLPHPTAPLSAPSTPAPVLIDCAGMDYETQSKLINTYRGTFPMYSDSGGRNGVPAPLQLHRSLHSIHADPSGHACRPSRKAQRPRCAGVHTAMPEWIFPWRWASVIRHRSSGGAHSRRSTFCCLAASSSSAID